MCQKSIAKDLKNNSEDNVGDIIGGYDHIRDRDDINLSKNINNECNTVNTINKIISFNNSNNLSKYFTIKKEDNLHDEFNNLSKNHLHKYNYKFHLNIPKNVKMINTDVVVMISKVSKICNENEKESPSRIWMPVPVTTTINNLEFSIFLDYKIYDYCHVKIEPRQYSLSLVTMKNQNYILDSNFDSGCLEQVKVYEEKEYKEKEYEDYIYLSSYKSSIKNSYGMSWFYFSISSLSESNSKKEQKKVEFIRDETDDKNDHDYIRFGLQLQENCKEIQNCGRHPIYRISSSLKWKRVSNYKLDLKNRIMYFDIPKCNEKIFIAKSIPYTIRNLNYDINKWERKSLQENSSVLFNEEINEECGSSIITISQKNTTKNAKVLPSIIQETENFLKIVKEQNKKIIILTGRQHASETSGSLVLKGTIDAIFSDSKNNSNTSKLLDKFVFLIFPMLNPDGVKYGLARNNIQGIDLNRSWNDKTIPIIDRIIKPTIEKVSSENLLHCFLDFHGIIFKIILCIGDGKNSI